MICIKNKRRILSVIFLLPLSSHLFTMEGDGAARGPQVQGGDIHVDGTGPVVMQVQGGEHHYNQRDDFSGGNRDASLRERMGNAAERGFLEGISALVAKMIIEITVPVILIGIKSLVMKLRGAQSSDVGGNNESQLPSESEMVLARMLKDQSEMVETQCAVAESEEEENECKKLRQQLRQLLFLNSNQLARRAIGNLGPLGN